MEVEHLKGYIGKTNRRVKHSDRLIASLKERNRILKRQYNALKKEYAKECNQLYRTIQKINKLVEKELA